MYSTVQDLGSISNDVSQLSTIARLESDLTLRTSELARLESDLTLRTCELAQSRSDCEHACERASKLEQRPIESEARYLQVSAQYKRALEKFVELQFEHDALKGTTTMERNQAAETIDKMRVENQSSLESQREWSSRVEVAKLTKVFEAKVIQSEARSQHRRSERISGNKCTKMRPDGVDLWKVLLG